MGTETYAKNGQVSKMSHATKKCGQEIYKGMYEPNPSIAGAPDAFERKYMNEYRKESLPEQGEDMGGGY